MEVTILLIGATASTDIRHELQARASEGDISTNQHIVKSANQQINKLTHRQISKFYNSFVIM